MATAKLTKIVETRMMAGVDSLIDGSDMDMG